MPIQGLEEVAYKLGQAAAEQIDRCAFKAITNGTNVTYQAMAYPDHDLPLIICGTKCDGLRATAADPLCQYRCPCNQVHQQGTPNKGCGFYDPRSVDTGGHDREEEEG